MLSTSFLAAGAEKPWWRRLLPFRTPDNGSETKPNRPGKPPFKVLVGSGPITARVQIPAIFPHPARDVDVLFFPKAEDPIAFSGGGNDSIYPPDERAKRRAESRAAFDAWLAEQGGHYVEGGFHTPGGGAWVQDEAVALETPHESGFLQLFEPATGGNVCLNSMHGSRDGLLITLEGRNNFHHNRRHNHQQHWCFLRLSLGEVLTAALDGSMKPDEYLLKHLRCILKHEGGLAPLYFDGKTQRVERPEGQFSIWINHTHMETAWTAFHFNSAFNRLGIGLRQSGPES